MSTPQSDAGEETSPPPQSPPVDAEKTNNDGAVIEDKVTVDMSDPPVEDKGTKENGEAAAAPSSSGGENPATAIAKEAATPPAKPSQPKQYVYDPKKITLKFIFANKDGVSVILDCKPADTVGEVKGALLSVWPEGEINVFSAAAAVCSLSLFYFELLTLS